MVNPVNSIIMIIQNKFENTPDLVIKTIESNYLKIYVVFLESLSESDKINDYILKELINNKKKINKHNISSFLAGPKTINITDINKLEFYLTNGFTLVITDNNVFAIETKANITRNVSTPDVETSINGPKDSFTENYQINLGLIKRRIKSSTLKIKEKIIGKKTETLIGTLYIDDITDKNIIKSI